MAVEPASPDYVAYGQDHQYKSCAGVVQVPVASRTAAHRLIRLHGGFGTRTVKWSASRYGKPPVIPRPESADDVLLATSVTPALPRPNEAAGGFDWTVSGEYVFAQVTPRVPGTHALPVGKYPFELPAQDTAARALSRSVSQVTANSYTFNSYYTLLGNRLVNIGSGSYIWPFLALPPAFSFGDAL
jgi:hypothetical protein